MFQGQWAGGCILYGDVRWVNDTFFEYIGGPVTSCQLVVVYSVVMCTLIPLIAGCFYVHAVLINRHRPLIEYVAFIVVPYVSD